MGIPMIDRAGPTEYQEFCIVQELRGKMFVTAIGVAALFACLIYLVTLP